MSGRNFGESKEEFLNFIYILYPDRTIKKTLKMNYINITFKDFINQQLNEVAQAKPETKNIQPKKTEDHSKLSWKEIVEKFNRILDGNDDV